MINVLFFTLFVDFILLFDCLGIGHISTHCRFSGFSTLLLTDCAQCYSFVPRTQYAENQHYQFESFEKQKTECMSGIGFEAHEHESVIRSFAI